MSAFFCGPSIHHHAKMGYFVSPEATSILHPITATHSCRCPQCTALQCQSYARGKFHPLLSHPGLWPLTVLFFFFFLLGCLLLCTHSSPDTISLSVPWLGHPGCFLELCGTKCMPSRVGRSAEPSLPRAPLVSQFQGVQSTPWS